MGPRKGFGGRDLRLPQIDCLYVLFGMDPFVIASRVAQLPGEVAAPPASPITPEDVATAVDTFKFQIGNAEGSSDEPSIPIEGKFNFRGMSVPVYCTSSGNFELEEVVWDEADPLEEMDTDAYENWLAMYGDFDWTLILKAIQDKHEDRINDLISDKILDLREAEEERRDPYGYRGLKRSDFY
jgi:hypothetical protein